MTKLFSDAVAKLRSEKKPREIRQIRRPNSSEAYDLRTAIMDLCRIEQFLLQTYLAHIEQIRRDCKCSCCLALADVEAAIFDLQQIKLPEDWDSSEHADELCPAIEKDGSP